MIGAKAHRHDFALPSKWSDLSDALMQEVAAHIMPASMGMVEHQAAIIEKIILAEIDAPSVELKMHSLLGEYYAMMIPAVEWIWKTPYKRVPFESFVVNETTYILPSDNLGNCTFREWVWLDKSQRRLSVKPSDKEIRYLVAIICRPAGEIIKDVEGNVYDVRAPLGTAFIGRRAEKFEQIDPETLFAIYMYYVGSVKRIRERFSSLFEGAKKADPTAPDFSALNKKNTGGWDDVAMRLCQSDVTKYDDILDKGLWTMLKFLESERAHHERMEAERKQKMNNK